MSKKKTTAGCFSMILYMLIVFPLWFAVMYGIMIAIDLEPWVWYVFYLYIPATVLFNIFRGMLLVIAEEDAEED